VESDNDAPLQEASSIEKNVKEIERRVRAVPGSHSIEEHGQGYAFYLDRLSGEGALGIGATHGLNILHLSEPDMKYWSDLKSLLENAKIDLLAMIGHYRHVVLAAQMANADLAAIGDLCEMTEDEYPLQAVHRLAREHREMRQQLSKRSHSLMSERAKLRSPNYDKLSTREKWEEDKRLDILDWDGSENT
jgi:hypothetical protein